MYIGVYLKCNLIIKHFNVKIKASINAHNAQINTSNYVNPSQKFITCIYIDIYLFQMHAFIFFSLYWSLLKGPTNDKQEK